MRLSLLVAGVLAVARPVAAQRFAPHPSIARVAWRSTVWASVGAGAGGSVGLLVDDARCRGRTEGQGTRGGFFGPCFVPAAEATAVGWFGGSAAGAALAAAAGARARGCPPTPARWRALGGAALGVLPGVLIVAPRPGHYPASRTAVLVATPVLAALGAAATVASCRGG